MAACAISSTARSGWCARRCTSARCCCAWRRTSSGRCASCCRRRRACARALLLRLGLFIYDWLGGAQAAAGDAHRRSHPPCGRPAAQAHRSATASNIPTARSTTRGSSCSTRSMPPSAAPSSAPAPAACAPSARDEWELVLNSARPARGRDRARAGQCRRPVDRRSRRHRDPRSRCRRRCGWSKAATSWCAAASSTTAAICCRPPMAASCSRCRSRGDFTLIGTTDENFVGDRQRAGAGRRRNHLSLRRGERIFPRPDHARRTGLVLRRRALAL